MNPRRRLSRAIWMACVLLATIRVARAHPGNGIVVDDAGRVWFMDTGFGLWQIDPAGRLTAHGGPTGHFLAIDRLGGFKHGHFTSLEAGDAEVSRIEPTLLVATSYPVAVGTDGAFYFPQTAGKGRVRMMRMAPGQAPAALADLPVIREQGYDGKEIEAEWVWGLAAGPDGAIYYTEQQAVRRIAADGTISTIAENVEVPDCERPPGARGNPVPAGLYGLDVAADGTVYVAAGACSAVLRIKPGGQPEVILRATDRWSPQGVAVAGDALYVLEYDYVASDDRRDWLPRVRKLAADGTVTLLAEVKQRPERAKLNLRQLPGAVWAGAQPPSRRHGALVHFPLMLAVLAVPAAALAWVWRQQVAWRVQALAVFVALVVGCVLAEKSGGAAADQVPYGPDGVPGIAWEYLHQHTQFAGRLESLAKVGALLSLAALMPVRLRFAATVRLVALTLALGVAAACAATAAVTGHYGGELVYGQGLGSDTLREFLAERAAANAAARDGESSLSSGN